MRIVCAERPLCRQRPGNVENRRQDPHRNGLFSIEDGFRGSGRQEMSNYLAQNRLAFGLDRSVAVVTWAAKARFRVLPCRVIARAGLRWCGGWRRMNLRGFHDQAQNQAEGCDPLNRPKDRQARSTQTIGACTVQVSRETRYQARPHHRNVADADRCNDRSDHDCYGLAAAFGAWFSCRCRPQEARAQPCFRANGQGTCVSHQGWQSCSRGPDQTGSLMQCKGNTAMVVARPKRLLRTRSSICAVSISRDYVLAGRACFKDGLRLILHGICCLRSSPIGSKQIASVISITQLSRCSIERLARRKNQQCPPVLPALTRSERSLIPARFWSGNGIDNRIE